MADTRQMANNDPGQDNNEPQVSAGPPAEPRTDPENQGPTSRDFFNISYVVLTIAAIFVINALETGSYRTPWPVALGVTLLGAGVFVYALHRKKQENR